MHRLFWYSAGSYLTSNKLLSAALLGLSAAEVIYSIQTDYLKHGNWLALTTAAVVFKAATGAAYVYQTVLK